VYKFIYMVRESCPGALPTPGRCGGSTTPCGAPLSFVCDTQGKSGITQMGPGSTGSVELKSLVFVVGACANCVDRGRRPKWKGVGRSFLGGGNPRSFMALVVVLVGG